MKKILLFICTVLLFGFSARPAEARVINVKQGSAVVKAGEIIDDDLFIAGETVDIAGEVTGDIYAAGGTVNFSGKAGRDLIIAGGTVNISGEVGQDVYIGSGNANITKVKIGDTLAAATGSLTVDKDSTVGGSFLVGAGMVNSSAPVERNVYIGAGSVSLNNSIGGDTGVAADSISLGDNVRIGKNLYYLSDNNKPEISASASVSGEINQIKRPEGFGMTTQEATKQARTMITGVLTGFKILGFLATLVTGLLLIWYWPKTSGNMVMEGKKEAGKMILTGLVASIVIFPLLVLLLITGVGAKLAFILLLTFILFSVFAKMITGYALGMYLTDQFGWKKATPYGIFALGLVTLSLVSMAPFVDVFIIIFSFWFGMGILTQKLLDSRGK